MRHFSFRPLSRRPSVSKPARTPPHPQKGFNKVIYVYLLLGLLNICNHNEPFFGDGG